MLYVINYIDMPRYFIQSVLLPFLSPGTASDFFDCAILPFSKYN